MPVRQLDRTVISRPSIRLVTVRGEKTREHLLDVAETLFGEQGVAGVSLREIRLASGARNTAAVQFHFGNRRGLLEALTERHMPEIAKLQRKLYEKAIADGRENDPRSLVEVLVRPAAEYLTRGPSERAWVKIMADLGQAGDLHLKEMVAVAPPAAQKAGNVLYASLTRSIPPLLARERIVALAQISVHMCADRARLEDRAAESRSHVPADLFNENLVDMVTAAVFAPLSDAAQSVSQPPAKTRRSRVQPPPR
jgi:AcrR family transcriptional regulator